MNVVHPPKGDTGSNMAEDLMTPKQIRYDGDTKNFLKEASAMIQLVNLVDNYRLRKTKLGECCVRKANEYNETNRRRKSRGPSKRSGADDGPRLRRAVCRKTTQPHKQELANCLAIRCKTKSKESHSKTIELKRISKCRVEILKPKIDKEINIEILKPKIKKNIKDVKRHETSKKHSHKRPRPQHIKNGSQRTLKNKIRRILSTTLDKTDVRIHSLKDIFPPNEKNNSRRPIILLQKMNSSKQNSSTKICNLSDSLLVKKSSTKRSARKLNDTHRVSKKKVIKKPSLHLMWNLHLKSNSNMIKMQIKSDIDTAKSCKSSDHGILRIRIASKSASCVNPERMDKISNEKQLDISTTRCAGPISQSSDDLMMKQHDTRHPNILTPYNKTQTVYNLYDVVPYEQPRQVQGIKSNISFSLNFGNPPPAEQTAYTDGTGSINTQNGTYVGRPCQVRYKNKMNYRSGWTSLQQSLSLGRKYPESDSYPSNFSTNLSTQPCNCKPMVCEPSVSDDQCTCSTCCQALPPETEPKPLARAVELLTAFKRTKRRIVERVTNLSREASSNPGGFVSRLQHRVINKYRDINSRVDERLKDEGNCTCNFIDTDRVSVYEENVEPECSFLKRTFGSLIYNDKCIVCTEAKKIGPSKFQCTPGVCVAADIFTKISMWYTKYKEKRRIAKCDKNKKNLKAKLEKAKRLSKKKDQQAKEKIKKVKEKARLKEEKRKAEDKRKLLKAEDKIKLLKAEDKRKLLTGKKGAKVTKHKDDDKDDEKKGTGAIEMQARRGLNVGRRHFRRATRRIRERYERNKKLAQEQKGRYACDFYLLSLRNRPCLWVYYMCPWWYPYCLQALNFWRQLSDLLLFFVAIIVWSPCILMAECLKVMACNMCV